MTTLDKSTMENLTAGSQNCGNWWQTQWVTTTCGLAGGMIGLAFGGIGASVGSFLGSSACKWICHYSS